MTRSLSWQIGMRRSLAAMALLEAAAQPLHSQVVDSAAIVTLVRDVYASIDARDTLALRALVSPDARRITPGTDGAYRALTVDGWIATLARRSETSSRLTTRLWNVLPQTQGSVVQTWFEYDTRSPGVSTQCGVGVADLTRVNKRWVLIALTDMRDAKCTRPPGPPGAARRMSIPDAFEPPDGDSAAIFADVRRAANTFLVQWKRAWIATESIRDPLLAARKPRPVSEPLAEGRNKAAHCHAPSDVLEPSQVQWSPASKLAACAMWYAAESALAADERDSLDGSLQLSLRGDIRNARRQLLQVLEDAAQRFPSNHFLVGQRIRFLVDQRDFAAATQVARACTSDGWWCASLAGYVLQRRGRSFAADSAFAIANGFLTEAARCEWTDIGSLLPLSDRAAYAVRSCAEKLTVSPSFWWLTDPMYGEPGNERRAEHFARKVLVLLNRGLERNERQMMATASGGEAILGVVERYGWPSFFGWAGLGEDDHHDTWLGRQLNPYTSFEYAGARFHAVPRWSAIERPFDATANDWSLFTSPENPWNTQEHFRPSRPIVQLDDFQVGLLRRQTSLLLAIATDLHSSALRRNVGDTVGPASLIVSWSPDSLRQVATATSTVGWPLVLSGTVTARPHLIAVEFPGSADLRVPGARTRFGIPRVPGMLSEMQSGETAISEPLLLRMDNGRAVPNIAGQAIPLMMGTTSFTRDAPLGVYWETYGLKPADSAEVAIWIERTTQQGAFRRLGIALDLSRNLNTPVVARWSQSVASGASVMDGQTIIIGQGVRLDVSQLPPGDYNLEVIVTVRGAEMRGRRAFTIKV